MVAVVYRLDPASQAVYDEHSRRGDRLVEEVQGAVEQGGHETASWLQDRYLRGGSRGVKRDGKAPLGVRSGRLLQSVGSAVTGVWEVSVGAIHGGVPVYAKVLLLGETHTIRPTRAKHLWIPVGRHSMSPRAAMEKVSETGKRLLRIFKSKKNNLVAFLPDARGGTYKRGKNKGRLRGKLLFVLKDEVEVKGTDALPRAVEDRSERNQQLIQDASNRALGGDT